MVWFQCEDCGENLKKPKLQRHFSMCSATKLSCIDCGNMFGQDSVQWHTQCMTEAEKYGPKGPSNGTPANPKGNLKEQIDFDNNGFAGTHSPSWFCSLCNSKSTCERDFFSHVRGKKHREKAKGFDAKQRKQFEQPTVVQLEPTARLRYNCRAIKPISMVFLCNIKATSQQNLLSHAFGNKHRARVGMFDAKQQQRQSENFTMDKKDNSKQLIKVDVNVGLSTRHPWFCSLCNTKATSQQSLLSHANGKKHRENVAWFNANQLQQSEQCMTDKKDTIENASNGDSEHKKVDLRVSSGVGNGYSQADKKRKLETFDETWNGEVVQAEKSEGGGEKERKSKKAKKQDHEKKQTESDSDFEYDKEDMKLLLVSYSKEELVDLVYKTAEKRSRLISAILESADRDISQRNIFVRGFGWDTTHEYLKAAFESYGEIEECSVVMDKDTGRSKGYGFVVFKTRKGAREALKNPEKRMYNRTVVCNLASAKPCGAGKVHDMVEPVKGNLTQIANQSDMALPGHELAHGHVLEQRHQQPTMEMFGQNMPFYGQNMPFDPMYGANQMIAGLPNYCMFGSGLMNQGSMIPSNHVGMAGQYFGDVERTWYLR